MVEYFRTVRTSKVKIKSTSTNFPKYLFSLNLNVRCLNLEWKETFWYIFVFGHFLYSSSI